MSRHRVVVTAGTGAALGAALGAGYAVQRAAVRRWSVEAGALEAAGLGIPDDAAHHVVPVDDGGRIHVVERGSGRPLVLLHGVTLGVEVWAHQLRELADRHRVIAIAHRGHGRSLAGDGGYSVERLGQDTLEVLRVLQVGGGVLAGHSMGGMVAQWLAVEHRQELADRVDGLVLMATSSGHYPTGPLAAGAEVARGAADRALQLVDRHGRGLIASRDLSVWLTRLTFGIGPRAADVELARSLTAAMSPSAMAALLDPVLRFDVKARLADVDRSTAVVAGSRDLLTPVRANRDLAERIPGAELVVLPGCGHMVMLERPAELNRLLDEFPLAPPATDRVAGG